MLRELSKARFPVELGILAAFCLFLPLVEFWKNVALIAYFAVWISNRARARDFGGTWRGSDTLIAIWIAAAYLAAAFAGLGGNAVGKTGDVAVSAILFWLVSRAGYASAERRLVYGALIASTIAGLALGYWRLSSGAAKSETLQLYSVGHVNHTAIYIAIMMGVAASWLFARWPAWRASRRTVAVSVGLLIFVSLVVTASRGAIGVCFALLLALALAWWPRWRAPLVASLAAIGITVALVVGLGAEVVRKQVDNAARNNVLSYRDGIWRMGLAAWEQYPWFGVGKDNYNRITLDRVRAWRTAAGKEFNEADYAVFPHAHNLYVNTLVERGLAGLGSLLAIMLGSLYALLRWRPRATAPDGAWLAWGGAASAWVITAGVGLVNTTFHHEHGLLTALLLGLWLSTDPRRSAS